jgi:hypothetical protein
MSDVLFRRPVEVGELLKTAAGREKLTELFPKQVPRASWLEDPTNQRTFAGCGVASVPAQANHPGCAGGACGVTEICEIMASGKGTPLELLAKVAAAHRLREHDSFVGALNAGKLLDQFD